MSSRGPAKETSPFPRLTRFPFFTKEISMHPLLWLPLLTFFLVLAYLVWNWISTKRNLETGGKTSGPGGPKDPMT
jgi:hypothetical protein